MSVQSPVPAHVIVGRCLIGFAVAGWLLSLASAVDGLPLMLAAFLRANAAMWALVCGGCLIAGIRLLWMEGHRRTPWQPDHPGQRFHTVVVYVRQDCPLCEEAVEILAEYQRWLPAALEVDIDDDPDLRDRFDETVPVVEVDGRVRFRGQVNEILLRRLIEGTSPLPSLKRRRSVPPHP